MTSEEMLSRIAKIDKMFDEAKHWGSWMVECSNERRGLVNVLNKNGIEIEHRHRTNAS